MLDSQYLKLAYPTLPNIISLYKEDSMYWLSGVTFREFMLGVERPIRLLLLSHDCTFAESEDCHTPLDYVDEDLEALVATNVKEYGDFWWVEIQSQDCLTKLPDAEFLRLLHLKQLGATQDWPHFPTLQNRFAYFGHDDGWATRLWVDSPELIRCILAQVLTSKYFTFSGRRSLPKPEEEIARALVARAEAGLFFDFRNVDAHAARVPIYCIGAVKNSDCARRISNEVMQNNPSIEWLIVDEDRWLHVRTS